MLQTGFLDVFAEVVLPVRDPHRRRGAITGTLGVGTGSVLADHLDDKVLQQPVGERVGGALGQQVDGAVRMQSISTVP